MHKMTKLCLAYTGYSFKAGKRERLAVLLKETGDIIKKLVLYLLEMLPILMIILPHFGIRLVEVRNSLFNSLSFSKAGIAERRIIHIS